MWWRDKAASRRAFLLGAVGLLGGCSQIQPLYAPSGPMGVSPQTWMAEVAVAPAGSRVDLKIRNELVFAFNNGQEPARPRYRLVLRTLQASVPIGTEAYQRLPSATLVQVNVGFQLREAESGRIVYQGTSFANATYDYSTQRFANARAALDAQDRAALVVAGDIRTKLAAWFAGNPQG